MKKVGIGILVLGFLLWTLSAATNYLLDPSQTPFWLPTARDSLFIAVTLVFFTLTARAGGNKPVSGELNATDLTKLNDENSSFLNNLPVGVYRATAEGKILRANRRFAEMLGYKDSSELENVNLNDVYTSKFERREHLERLRKAPVFAEFELRRVDGRTIWVRDYPRAIMTPDGHLDYVDGVCVETHGIDAIVRDIAEHKRLQRMKDDFIVAVTHELRTPLVSIKGYVDHIIAREPNLSDNVKSKIDVVKRNTDRLLELTDDLLNVQDMENGRLEFKFQTFNLHEAFRECLEDIQPLISAKGQEIRLEVPGKSVPVLCDGLRLNEVLANLLTNASKFSPEGGSITIRVEEDDATVTISVSDNGIGIDKKDLERVFEPFAAIEKPSYIKGTGLGLSLTRKLVEAQGGRIWATSLGKGQGATFAFTLPKSREELIQVHG